MLLKDLINKNNIIVRMPNKNLISARLKCGTYSSNKTLLSSDIMFRAIITASNHCVYVNIFEPNVGFYSLYLDNTIDVEMIESTEVLEALKRREFENLRDGLVYRGTIGCDPEIFVEDKDGVVIPAFEFLGSKEKPDSITCPTMSQDPRQLYWDGYQAEFNTNSYDCLGYHGNSIHAGLQALYDKMIAHNKEAKLSDKTTMPISFERLATDKPEHVEFGCMPSYNVYKMEGIKDNGRNVGFRSAGGHLHFGINNRISAGEFTHETIIPLVKALDAILGVACVSMFASQDTPLRRCMYGLAGEYRLPPHGLEYRTLSNAWLFSPLATNIVFELGRKALMFGHKGFMDKWVHNEEETIRIINTCDVEAARKVLITNRELLIRIIDSRFYSIPKAEFVYGIIINGIESVVSEPGNVTKNWMLDTKGFRSHWDVPHMSIAGAYDLIANKKTITKVS